MRRTQWLIEGVLLAPLVLAAACDRTCTNAGCPEILTITVRGAEADAVPPSVYEIALDLGGASSLAVCGANESGALSCEPVEGAADFEIEAQFDADGAIVLSAYSEGGKAPQTVSVSIIAADAPLVDEAFALTYAEQFPNGEDCGACPVADPIEIRLPAP